LSLLASRGSGTTILRYLPLENSPRDGDLDCDHVLGNLPVERNNTEKQKKLTLEEKGRLDLTSRLLVDLTQKRLQPNRAASIIEGLKCNRDQQWQSTFGERHLPLGEQEVLSLLRAIAKGSEGIEDLRELDPHMGEVYAWLGPASREFVLVTAIYKAVKRGASATPSPITVRQCMHVLRDEQNSDAYYISVRVQLLRAKEHYRSKRAKEHHEEDEMGNKMLAVWTEARKKQKNLDKTRWAIKCWQKHGKCKRTLTRL